MPDKFVILPPIDGLVAYYPFNGNAKDESGNQYDGIVHGATLTEDRFGNQNQAYKFDGADDNIDCGDILNNLDVPYTISSWINIQAYDKLKDQHIITSELNYPIDPTSWYYCGLVFYISSMAPNGTDHLDKPILANFIGDGTGTGMSSRRTGYSSVNLPRNQWVYVAAVVRGPQNMDFYINNENVASSYSGTGGNMMHNNWHVVIGYAFNGIIDELCIFNRALSDAEILQLYNSGI